MLYARQSVQPALRPLWVTWGHDRWAGSARVYEDSGTRNLPAVLALGDALDFQEHLGESCKADRYRELRTAWRDATATAAFTRWRSPAREDLGASLFAVEILGTSSTEFANRMFREHGFVMRAFRTEDLNTVRISPNVFNTEEEMRRFFTQGAQIAG